MNSTIALDPISVSIALSGLIFGPALAGIIGPYAVILVAAMVGSAWALGRSEQQRTRTRAVLFFARLGATAALVTVGIASAFGNWFGVERTDWMLAPIAMLVGGVGDDWPVVGKWLIQRLGRLIERRTEGN